LIPRFLEITNFFSLYKSHDDAKILLTFFFLLETSASDFGSLLPTSRFFFFSPKPKKKHLFSSCWPPTSELAGYSQPSYPPFPSHPIPPEEEKQSIGTNWQISSPNFFFSTPAG